MDFICYKCGYPIKFERLYPDWPPSSANILIAVHDYTRIPANEMIDHIPQLVADK